MRILFVTTAHNSLSQRAWIELSARGHEVSVELAISDATLIEAVERYRPDLIVAPFMKKRIPEAIWSRYKCLVIHPGIRGDRGPSSLDWAIQEAEEVWGVTLLEAVADFDAGDIWAWRTFAMSDPHATKSSLYRGALSDAAADALLEAVAAYERGVRAGEPLSAASADVRGRLRRPMKQGDRRIDWKTEGTAAIARKIRAGDSTPGVLDRIYGVDYYVFGAHEEDALKGEAGEVLAQRDGAICRATVDGAIWISHLKERREGKPSLKLPATMALGARAADLPISRVAIDAEPEGRTLREIQYREKNGVGYLSFDFYNGAMSTEQCERLREAYLHALSRPTRVIALLGGRDFWSNGIHLNTIEAAPSPAGESWRNINAIDDLILEILATRSHFVVAGMRGNAGAGGAMLALAADEVHAHRGVVMNPHYRAMGLFGSEYWTYTLPRRVGRARAIELTEGGLPIGALAAREIGLLDGIVEGDRRSFGAAFSALVEEIAASPDLDARIAAKNARRLADEAEKPLARYRDAELARMHQNFYGATSTYHESRRRFVYKIAPTATCTKIAIHRRAPEALPGARASTESTPPPAG